MKVMIYSQDSLGLGHLRRTTRIGHALQQLAPDTNFLYVADSPQAPFFDLPKQSQLLKLPTVVKVDSGVWKVYESDASLKSTLAHRAELIKSHVLDFMPDAVLVDHMPHGVLGELLPCLEALQQTSPPPLMVLGLRDILGAPEVIIRQWQGENAYEALEQFYDHALIYGMQSLFDVGQQYQFSASVQQRFHYCSYVGPIPKPLAEPQTKAGKAPFRLLIMGGGGHDAYPWMSRIVDFLKSDWARSTFQTTLFSGPFMPPFEQQKLQQAAADLPIELNFSTREMATHLEQAAVVIAMAGYNTVCDVLGHRKKNIFIPRPGPSAEQSMRTALMRQRGWIDTLAVEALSPANLREKLQRLLTESDKQNDLNIPPLDGAERAANFLLAQTAVKKSAQNSTMPSQR